ncbi:MAG TPA: hypothetical protein VLB51_03555 [Methylomirabilota bacterium]|nr:hypothetical protein [Methylomirabilota bacterium]
MRGLRACAALVLVFAAATVSAQTDWVDHPDNPVLGPGEPGAWDEGGRRLGTVILVDSTFHMWFLGSSPDTYIPAGIGHATSSNGVEWTMDASNPVLEPGDPGDWDAYFWSPTPAVLYDGTRYNMWYVASPSSTDGSTLRGGYATSPDGSVWTKYEDNPVLEVGPAGSWDDYYVAPGSAIFDSGVYKLWYSGYNGSFDQIGYAESTDGIEWVKFPTPVLGEISYPDVWDPWVFNPSVVFDGSVYHMWYAGGDYPVGEWMIGYAFSTDGVEWSRHRDNPVISVAGVHIWDMKVAYDGSFFHGWHGSAGYEQPSMYATSECCPGVVALENVRYIPAAAYAAGAEGSFYETDLDLSNAGDQAVEYQLQWLPRGQSNTDPTTSEEFTLGAGMSVRYANVLSEVFGLEPDAFGALTMLSTSPDLMAMARIANVPQDTGEGSFGQAIPALQLDDFAGFHERRRLLFGTENADMRFNVGCLNADTSPARVTFELFRSDGTLLGSESLLLMPFDNNQLNRIFDPYHPAIGHVDYWSAATSGRVWCYGSVLDNVTSDPTTVPPQ